jgi:phosphoglycerate dehydrogenase-like enzyme
LRRHDGAGHDPGIQFADHAVHEGIVGDGFLGRALAGFAAAWASALAVYQTAPSSESTRTGRPKRSLRRR